MRVPPPRPWSSGQQGEEGGPKWQCVPVSPEPIYTPSPLCAPKEALQMLMENVTCKLLINFKACTVTFYMYFVNHRILKIQLFSHRLGNFFF